MYAFQLVSSFVIGGLVIGLQTLLGERARGIWRGIVLTIPSTIAISMFFIGLTKSPADVVDIARIFPAVLALAYIFVTVFAFLAHRGLIASMLGGLLSWAGFSLIVLFHPPETFFTSVFIYSIPLTVLLFLAVRSLPQVSHLKVFPLSVKHIFIRALIAGSVVTIAVIFAKMLGNLWGGLMAGFPAVFTSTFGIYHYLQGKTVIPSVAKSVFFPGAFGMILYAFAASLAFPQFGIWAGTFIAYGANFLFLWLYLGLARKFHIDEAKSPA